MHPPAPQPAIAPSIKQVSTLLVAETDKPITNLSHGQQSVVGKDLQHALIPGARPHHRHCRAPWAHRCSEQPTATAEPAAATEPL